MNGRVDSLGSGKSRSAQNARLLTFPCLLSISLTGDYPELCAQRNAEVGHGVEGGEGGGEGGGGGFR
jgi:hypothetical protein